MTNVMADKKVQLIAKVIATLKDRLSAQSAPMVQEFTQQYYAWVPPEDMVESDPEDLYGQALSYWNFIRQRQPEVPSIRVYNPNFEEYGWQSTHTVVEIVIEDMPFLVDSITMELNRQGLTVQRTIHPIINVVRDAKGNLQQILPPGSKEGTAEATMHFEVNRRTDANFLEKMRNSLLRILRDVRVAVEDWRPMRQRMLDIVESLDPETLPTPGEDVAETKAFLRWIEDNHFTFLGYRGYDLAERENGELVLTAVPNSSLGILREEHRSEDSQGVTVLRPQLRPLVYAPNLLIITKASARSTVHRPAHLDYLGIKRFDKAGKVIGEWRFLGLFTSLAYSMKPQDIPLLRRKAQRLLEQAHLAPVSYSGKAFHHIIDTFPRDELFQASEDELFDIAMGILHLQERQRLRLFVREDPYGRFVSCLVYVPRDRYDTDLRRRMQDILMETFHGESVEFITQFTESVLARVLFHIRTTPGAIPDYDRAAIEGGLREALRGWSDDLQRVLLERCGEEAGNRLYQRYQSAFAAAYREDFNPRTAVSDLLRLETLSEAQPLAMHLYRPLEQPAGQLRFKIYGRQPFPLSDVLPMLERLGLKVHQARPYEVSLGEGSRWIVDFDLTPAAGLAVEVSTAREHFQAAFAQLWRRALENDRFNRLVLGAGLAWGEVALLRAYSKYLLQTRIAYSQAYMERTLNRHPGIARQLVDLFHTRFDPDGPRDREASALVQALEAALEQVQSLDEDRILRRFLNIIQATLRTNYYQSEANQPKDYLSFKFDPRHIDDLPLPRPRFEIFVYSPRVEAVHLRGGPVARGGLRWSDRPEDFRTEVLGLMKAQMVKNAVIVPVGSKGGFVVKRPPREREALHQEVVACYRTFIRGLLDLTDNRVGDEIQPPPRVVRHDPDDPYLVVAADKGTATFSDIANGIARDYGFWLDDAFASGGSAGYDHKKMGITARGAWESVKRHFRERGQDIQERDTITVLGIGDMAGDVFGNGLLLSRQLQLVAAFNHLHIFIDPDPDPEQSYQERERLFQLPRSTWDDYDKNLLSSGGGIYPRTAKAITVSAQARERLGLDRERYTPHELIQALLKAPVDLLWNGGIGTYVKAHFETQAEVGDKTNDPVRVNGRDLRCQVVGEGGNLGFTQPGRIEFALQGGKILTDAIDNAGGVNCSDHEVNIKILLNQVVAQGDMTEKQRNDLLARMTPEVAELVLRQNYLQPQAISLIYRRAVDLLSNHVRVIRSLEKSGRLNRALEFLPSDEELVEREAAGRGLVPSEIAVLLAYGKITLYEKLLDSDVPEDPYLQRELRTYFPTPLRERFAREMEAHPLRREIIATYITNSMLNRMGSSFAFRLWEETGEKYATIARAYSAAREIFDARELWSAIEALDNQVAADLQLQMLGQSQRLLERATLWLLRNRRPPLAVEEVVTSFSPGVATLTRELPQLIKANEYKQMQAACQRLMEGGVPEDLARRVAGLDALYSALDLVEVAEDMDLPVEAVGSIYFGLVSCLELNWLRESIARLPATTHWQHRARAALFNSLYEQGRNLTADVLHLTSAEDSAEQRLDNWLEGNRAGIERCRSIFTDLRAAGQPDLAMLSVVLRETANLTQSGKD